MLIIKNDLTILDQLEENLDRTRVLLAGILLIYIICHALFFIIYVTDLGFVVLVLYNIRPIDAYHRPIWRDFVN